MGQYQRISIDEAFENSIEEIEVSLRSEVSEVAEAVEDLGRRFEALPVLLSANAGEAG
jgi:hypothetical protein